MVKNKSDDIASMYLPVAEMLPAGAVDKVEPLQLEFRKMNEIAELLWVPRDVKKEEIEARRLRALMLYESLGPADGAEGMLAIQMVGTHSAALECLRRAALPDQTFEGRDMALKHAQKLMTLYAQQLATLNKHRGKGQQKVTVEHVNVEAGGQAIVGNVETGQSSKSKKQTPPEIECAPEVPMPDVKFKSTVARKRKK